MGKREWKKKREIRIWQIVRWARFILPMREFPSTNAMDIKNCKKTTKLLFCSCFFCRNTVSCMTPRRKFRECIRIDVRRETGISKYFRQRLSRSKLIPFIIFVFLLFLANKYRDIEFINFDRASSIGWQQLQLLIKRSQILSADRTSSKRKVTLLKRDPLSFLYHPS